jgi:hypothetical protein
MPYSNRKKQQEYQKEWYARNSEKQKANAKKHKQIAIQRNREYIWDVKSENPCTRCGEKDPACLEFHHLDSDEKESAISNAAGAGWSLERLQSEVDKCVILCRNCHAKLHYYQSLGE